MNPDQALGAGCWRGSVAAMMALTDFWLNPLKPPRRCNVSKWLPMALSATVEYFAFWVFQSSLRDEGSVGFWFPWDESHGYHQESLRDLQQIEIHPKGW